MSALKYTSFLLAPLLIIGSALAEPKVTYVGLGRYACSGSSDECKEVRRRNDELAEREAIKANAEQSNRMLHESLIEERRQTKLLEEIRDQQQR